MFVCYSNSMNRQALTVDTNFTKLFNRVIEQAPRYGATLERTHLMNKVKLAIRNIAMDGNNDWIDARNAIAFDYSTVTSDQAYYALYQVTLLLTQTGYKKGGK